VLQMISEPTLTVSWACTGQLRRIRWHTGQGRGYVRITRGSSERDMVRYVYANTGRIDMVKRVRSWLGVDQ
jgi:hypothetical protein